MELYIGGFAQGKLDYVKEQYPSAKVFENLEDFMNAGASSNCGRILNGLHLIIKQMLAGGIKADEIERRIMPLAENSQDTAIICNEIGCGIVPLDKDERLYRELTGRILVKLASKADKVVRITCGIPQRIK